MVIVVSSPIFVAAEAPAGENDLKSLDLDGSTEGLGDSTLQTLGVANEWTVAVWIKWDDLPGASERVFIAQPTSAPFANIISIFWNSGQSALQFIIHDSAGNQMKQRRLTSGDIDFGVWQQWGMIWDGTNFLIYKDGTDVTADTTLVTDNSGSMTDTSRTLFLGCSDAVPNHLWDGRYHSAAMWDVELSSDAFTDLYNGGEQFDWTTSNGNYTETTNLQHYWRLGKDSGDIGADSGVASTLIDVMDNSSNITAADIVDDYPGI